MLVAMEPDLLPAPRANTHLFTVRLWVEAVSHDQDEVRMQVKHILSGETRYFRDGWLLLTYLLTKIQEVECENSVSDDALA